MKLGIFADVHNNVIALEAVLQELNERGCEIIVCAGDLIGIGPCPEETVQRMMAIPNLVAVRGNHEKYLLEGMPSQYPNDEGMDVDEMDHHRWEHARLSPSSVAFLSDFPYRAEFSVLGKSIAVAHYCMDSNHQYVRYTPHPTESDLLDMFSDFSQDIVIYGHDHARTVCHGQNRWFINSGSLGCPAGERDIARAAVLEITEENAVSVQSIEVKYDATRVIQAINRLNYPASAQIKRIFFGVR